MFILVETMKPRSILPGFSVLHPAGAWPLVLARLLKMEELQQWAGNYRL